MTPTETMQWTVKPSQDHAGLQLSEAPISSVGSNDVLIKIQAIPLNQRDLTISNGTYSMATAPGMVAG